MSAPERIWVTPDDTMGWGVAWACDRVENVIKPSIEYILFDAVAEMIRQAVEAEREACAKVCEEWGAWNDTAQAIAAAIRARGEG